MKTTMVKIAFKPTKEQDRIFKYVAKRKENLLIEARAGCGKCLGRDTPVLMYDGTIKPVQKIVDGDLLMGDDNQPRKILNTNVGVGELYKVIPNKGDSWVCNDVHVMTLHDDRKKILIDKPLNEIVNHNKYSNGNFRNFRLTRVGVEYPTQDTICDPYLVGLWLGDGTKANTSPKFTINEDDIEIIQYFENLKFDNITTKVKKYSGDNGCYTIALTTENYSNNRNILKYEFDTCKFGDDIGIPVNYLINSRDNRLRLLGGLLDSDGHYCGNSIEYTTKYDKLSDDILYLCRSLGLAAYKTYKKSTIKSLNFTGYYWRITISGDYSDIFSLKNNYTSRQQIKSVLRTGFKVENIGVGEYYGFTLDGNGRFLLGDFTITHNTTTAIEALKLIPNEGSITFLAFNKHIQSELKEKLPEHVNCYTMHGLGMGAIKRTYGDSIKMDEFKVDHILKKKSTSWGLADEFPNAPAIRNEYLKSLKILVNLCRSTLTLERKWVEILANKYDVKYKTPKDIKRAVSVLEILMKDRKTFDFTDMIFLPAVDKKIWLFPQDYVIVDEAQDLNKAQQTMIFKMLKRDRVNKKKITGRLIAIGDPFQSIYSFAGADQNSFEWFRKFKNTEVLPLTHTFRCGKEIVKKANEIVPDLKAMDNAHEGQVRSGDVIAEPEAGDFVLCRTTAPLLQLYMEYLSTGRKAMIKGSDIGLSLIEMTKEFNSIGRLLGNWVTELDNLKLKLRKQGILDYKEHSGYLKLKDSVETLQFLCHSVETIAQLRKKIADIFTDKIDGIMLSTVHKAKGLEADRVFIACPDKLPLKTGKAWEYQQEKNLEYVAITRARFELIYDHEWQPIDLSDNND